MNDSAFSEWMRAVDVTELFEDMDRLWLDSV